MPDERSLPGEPQKDEPVPFGPFLFLLCYFGLSIISFYTVNIITRSTAVKQTARLPDERSLQGTTKTDHSSCYYSLALR